MIKTTVFSVMAEHFSYPVYIGENLLSDACLLKQFIKSKQIFIISNPSIARWYLRALQEIYTDYQCDYYLLPEGENYKTIEQWQTIINALIQCQHHRDTTLIALGGGVVGDITGFAAACYQRGVSFIQIPTSLLAQVDAAIGGKTAVNHPAGKNLIGAFHQPQAVIIDLKTLSTLPTREYNAGIAEIIKAALIDDPDFFSDLELRLPKLLSKTPHDLQYCIERACQIKARIIAADEKEQKSKRILLNLGHTFAHALEQTLEWRQWLHGETVALGLVAAAELSGKKHGLKRESIERIYRLLSQIPLPVTAPELDYNAILSAMSMDKKIKNQRLQFILLKEIGQACIDDQVHSQEVYAVLQQLNMRSRLSSHPPHAVHDVLTSALR